VACDDNARLLHAYLDGELDLVRSLEIEEHLKTCPDCAQELRSHQTLRRAFRASNLYERTPAGLQSRIRAALAREAGTSAKPHPISQAPLTGGLGALPFARRREFWNWASVAAAILLAVVLTLRFLPGRDARLEANLLAEEIVASHIRALQPGHLLDVQSTDQHTVKPWFNGKVDFSPPVRDLAEAGYPLLGGRLDYVARHPAAALVYQRRQHLIDVFIWPGEGKPAPPNSEIASQGYNILCWQSSGMDFCAVSDLNSTELQQFVELLQK
jgi:anti-sigma factor RsiW